MINREENVRPKLSRLCLIYIYIDAIKMREAKIEEMSEADMKRYAKYIASDLDLSSLAKVTKGQMDRIKVCL